MAAVLSLLRILGPALAKGAEAGTLAEIAKTAARLFELLHPLLSQPTAPPPPDPEIQADQSAVAIRPAQPEDPVFARDGRPRFGGR